MRIRVGNLYESREVDIVEVAKRRFQFDPTKEQQVEREITHDELLEEIDK